MKPQDYEVRIRPLSEGEGGGFFAEVPSCPAACPMASRRRKRSTTPMTR